MDWTKLENTFIKESRIESDIIQIKDKFALLLVTKQIAMAIVDLDTPVIPAAFSDLPCNSVFCNGACADRCWFLYDWFCYGD